MAEIGIASVGAYVPYWRLDRKTIADAWGIPAMRGERTAAAADEDAVTMAVEAAMVATRDIDTKAIDGVIFATTTSPYREKQMATTIATVLDCREDILTFDVADSLRGATTAFRIACDRIRSGSAQAMLVCGSDSRLGEPESTFEQIFGDGAGAVIVASEDWAVAQGLEALPVTLVTEGGVSEESLGPWRRDTDRFVQSFEAKVETRIAYAEQATTAARSALEAAQVGADAVDRAVIAAPDPRAQAAVAKAVGTPNVHDLYFGQLGNLGTATPFILLAGALEEAQANETLLVVGAGDGADALVLRTTDALPALRSEGKWGTLTPLIEAKGMLDSYEQYARSRKLTEKVRPERWSSAITYMRDLPMELPLYGMTCVECGIIQYPIGKRCMECSAAGPHPTAKLARRGKVFTFTLDHLVLGEYWNDPVPRAVIDLEGGGRLFCELTDCDPDDVHIEMPVELTFRCLHEGAGFRNYYWKGRPVRVRQPAAVSA